MFHSNAREQAKPRLHGLDYLRGLAALGIMVYHYSSWTYGEQAASSFLGRIGIYGVAIFYILSGQTLSYIYKAKLRICSKDFYDFYKKRFFRIMPLFWLATFVSIIFSKHIPDATDFFLNITGLFGLLNWNSYFATGAWSIGNELVFYLLFPILIYCINRHHIILFIFVITSLIVFFYFAFHIITPKFQLTNQWRNYTNPLNQFLFFISGVLIGSFVKPDSLTKISSISLITFSLIIFTMIPVNGNSVRLVIGTNRLFFSVSCLLICIGFFKTSRFLSFFDIPLSLLGKSSYSLYLLHPLIYAVIKTFFSLTLIHKVISSTFCEILISIIFSIFISNLSYKYFESFFIKISHA